MFDADKAAGGSTGRPLTATPQRKKLDYGGFGQPFSRDGFARTDNLRLTGQMRYYGANATRILTGPRLF
jgi:hypothetical protein